jgi:hypothetical protein
VIEVVHLPKEPVDFQHTTLVDAIAVEDDVAIVPVISGIVNVFGPAADRIPGVNITPTPLFSN